MATIYIDFESPVGHRKIFGWDTTMDFKTAVDKFSSGTNADLVVRYINGDTGEVIKGKMYDTTEKDLPATEQRHLQQLMKNVKIQEPIEPSQHEPRDRFQENKTMDDIKKFKNIIRECLLEIKRENDPRARLKESLRGIVKKTLNEMTANVPKPEPDKEEKEIINKQYNKKGNERLDKTNEKKLQELESIVHGIDPKWEAYIDDHSQFIVRAQDLLYVRIAPKFENNFDIDAMVKLVDRVRAISLTWEQVKKFVKANFSDIKNSTIPDRLHQKSIDNEYEKGVNQKAAGPETDIIKNRGEKRNGEDAKIKDTKKDDMDYNEPMTKRDEDMPDQPMKDVTKPGEDPEGKNHDIKKTDKVKPPKHKNDKKLRVSDKKTPKFVKKQVS